MNSSKKLLGISVLLMVLCVGLLLTGPEKQGSQDEESVSSEGLLFYCAAGMKEPVQAIAMDYEAEYGVPVEIQFGGSGTLLSNIKVSNHGDLYLAADESYLEIAKNEGLVKEIIPLAEMVPVIAVLKGNPKNIESITDLLRDDVSFGLANPEAAAVGKETRRLLDSAGQWTAVEMKAKVFKPTVMDLANDVKLGTIDAAILWDAVVGQYEEMESVLVPELEGGGTLISVGVMTASEKPTSALRFARYLSAQDRGLAEFAKSGFRPAEGDLWTENPQVVLFSGGVNRLAIEKTLDEFEQREGVDLVRSYNGCGILVAQMKTGEVPDAYFACDVSFMRNVPDIFPESVVISETPMVIIVPKGNPMGIHSLVGLAQERLKIGIANAEQSALGKLTSDLLQEEGLLDAVMKNVVTQTPTADLLVNQMQTGSLDAAIVYKANTPYVRDKLEIIPIDSPSATAIQPYGIANQSENKQIMRRLLDTLSDEHSKNQFEQVGFDWKSPKQGS